MIITIPTMFQMSKCRKLTAEYESVIHTKTSALYFATKLTKFIVQQTSNVLIFMLKLFLKKY